MSNKIEEEKGPAQQPQQVQKIFDEDDDDFEEFEQEGSYLYLEVNHDLKIDIKQWREDWDDEDLTDEFSIQLKQELAQK